MVQVKMANWPCDTCNRRSFVKLQCSTLIKRKVFGFNLCSNSRNPKWNLTFSYQCLALITTFSDLS